MKAKRIGVLGTEKTRMTVRAIAKTSVSDGHELCFESEARSLISVVSPAIEIKGDMISSVIGYGDKGKYFLDECINDAMMLIVNAKLDLLVIDFYQDLNGGIICVGDSHVISSFDHAEEYLKNIGQNQFIFLTINDQYETYSSMLKDSISKFTHIIRKYSPQTALVLNKLYYNKENSTENELVVYAEEQGIFSCHIEDYYVTGLHGIRTSILKTQNDITPSGTIYQMMPINADFSLGNAFWKKWDSAYICKDNTLTINDTISESDAWHLALSHDIEIPVGCDALRLSFDYKIEDKSIMQDKRIFALVMFDNKYDLDVKHSVEINTIVFDDDDNNNTSVDYRHYERYFRPSGRFASIGPSVRKKGTVSYRNIQLNLEYSQKRENAYSDFCETKSNITILMKNRCVGCGVCENACPVDSISMKEDEEGFLHPAVDDKCILCGKCARVCPALNRYHERYANPKTYAVRSERSFAEQCSAAGFFSMLADMLVASGWHIAGVVFDQQFNVVHTVTNDPQIVKQMRKSKYVQSNPCDVYKRVKGLLEDGEKVLFSGTPCQVAGLMLYLEKDYQNLVTLDLVCHGVPSPKMWRKYLSENYHPDEIESIDFRHRGDFTLQGTQYLSVKLKSGRTIVKDKRTDSYYKYFLSDAQLRHSCYHCGYAVPPRSGDFSVGDFWGAPSVMPEIVDGERLSVVFVNSGMADHIFEQVKCRFNLVKPVRLKDALVSNRSGVNRRRNPARQRFNELVDAGYPFDKAVRMSLYPEQYDVLLVGSTSAVNYGAILTNYSLYHAMKNMGIRIAITMNPFEGEQNHRIDFYKKYTEIVPDIKRNNFLIYNWMTETFLVGSDQLWNYSLFKNDRYYLDFASDEKKSIAYGTSFGFDYYTAYDKYQYNVSNHIKSIKRFDAISVREAEGVYICQEVFDVNADHVLDPVFLVDKEVYEKIADKSIHKPSGRYMTSYFLSAKVEESNHLLAYVSRYLNLSMINMLSGRKDVRKIQKETSIQPMCEDLTVEDWLYNIQNSEFVVTGSYHAMCFSIIFGKKFIVLQKDWAVARIISLLNCLGLSDRLISSFDEIKEKEYLLVQEIDYNEVYDKLNLMRNYSMSWLSSAIKQEKTSKIFYSPEGCGDGERPEFMRATTVRDYFTAFNKVKNDYILCVCNHGNVTIHKLTRRVAIKLYSLTDWCATQSQSDRNMIDSKSRMVVTIGHGKINERNTSIIISKQNVELLRCPKKVFAVSFDYATDATEGKFKLQLASAPWDDLCDETDIKDAGSRGHVEYIYCTSNNIEKWDNSRLQVRVDNVVGTLVIYNLRVEYGYRPDRNVTRGDLTNKHFVFYGFAAIADAMNKHLKMASSSLGALKYSTGKNVISINYQNQGYGNCEPVSEIHIDANGKRKIIPLEDEGIYFVAIARNCLKIVDISFAGCGNNQGMIRHR